MLTLYDDIISPHARKVCIATASVEAVRSAIRADV
jgi:hypothetical protein